MKMQTIDQVLGPCKTERTLTAWSNALDFVADTMKSHALCVSPTPKKEPFEVTPENLNIFLSH